MKKIIHLSKLQWNIVMKIGLLSVMLLKPWNLETKIIKRCFLKSNQWMSNNFLFKQSIKVINFYRAKDTPSF